MDKLDQIPVGVLRVPVAKQQHIFVVMNLSKSKIGVGYSQ